jgi:DNA-binding MarR family transcriptional regulator
MAPIEKITENNAARQPFMPVMRELVRAYQAFESYDAEHIRKYGITAPQADVIFTLGNTEGMVFKEIGERTLITKGTLTGVIDRLENKGLVKRTACPKDRRRMYVVLTSKGEKVFKNVFPRHIAYLKQRFDRLSQAEMKQAEVMLKKIRNLF